MKSDVAARSEPSSTIVLASISILFAYGCAIGAIYLRSYWGAFGIDPFQFATATDLAVKGLAATGPTLGFILVAGIVGEVIGNAAAKLTPKYKWLPIVIAVLVAVFIAVLVIFVSFGRLLVIGMIATWVLQALAWRSDFLRPMASSKHAPLIIAALVYPPIATHYLAKRAALNSVERGRIAEVIATSPGLQATLGEHASFIGRVGDTYFLRRKDGQLTVVPADSVQVMRLVQPKTETDGEKP